MEQPGKHSNISRGNSRDLLSREEEYKRLNEELEARTADLVREADEVMRDQDSVMSKRSMLDNISTEDFLNDWEEEELNINEDSRPQSSAEPAQEHRVSSSRTSSAAASKLSNRQPKARPKSGLRSKSKSAKSNVDDVAVMDDTLAGEFSLQKTIAGIEGRLHSEGDDEDDDLVPSAAAEMGAEAQMRFLKAKLRVMQEELDRLAQELNSKEELLSASQSKTKEMEEQKNRFQRTNVSQQTQMDKYKRLADDAKGKADSLDAQLTAAKKELESLRRSQKQQANTQSATEVRLNRALEDVEKLKAQLSKARSQSKESGDSDKHRMEQLVAENKMMQKQKNELITGFKKQLKLIDILKKQKIHMEAAKILAFTEEEFVKALEWGN